MSKNDRQLKLSSPLPISAAPGNQWDLDYPFKNIVYQYKHKCACSYFTYSFFKKVVYHTLFHTFLFFI